MEVASKGSEQETCEARGFRIKMMSGKPRGLKLEGFGGIQHD